MLVPDGEEEVSAIWVARVLLLYRLSARGSIEGQKYAF